MLSDDLRVEQHVSLKEDLVYTPGFINNKVLFLGEVEGPVNKARIDARHFGPKCLSSIVAYCKYGANSFAKVNEVCK